MSLWVSSKRRGNRKIHTCGERLVTPKDYLRTMKTFQVNKGHGILDYDSQGILMYGVIGLAARITGTEMP